MKDPRLNRLQRDLSLRLYEAIKNNSPIEGDSDDSLLFPEVRRIKTLWTGETDQRCILRLSLPDNHTAYITIAIR